LAVFHGKNLPLAYIGPSGPIRTYLFIGPEYLIHVDKLKFSQAW